MMNLMVQSVAQAKGLRRGGGIGIIESFGEAGDKGMHTRGVEAKKKFIVSIPSTCLKSD